MNAPPTFDARPRNETTSESPMSSPPPELMHNNGNMDTITVARAPSHLYGGVAAGASASVNKANFGPGHAISHNPDSANNSTAPEKPKRTRKKKAPEDGETASDAPKVKKPRKPREPKTDPDGTKKKVGAKGVSETSTQPRQSTVTEMFSSFPQQPPAPSSTTTGAPQPQHRTSETTVHPSMHPTVQHMAAPPARPFSSGQNYDPIRGSTRESLPRPSIPTNGSNSAHGSPQINRASASPAIASLIDPPTSSMTTHPPQTAMEHPTSVPSQQSPPPPQPTSAFVPPPQPQPPSPSLRKESTLSLVDGAMDIEAVKVRSREPEIKVSSKSSSSAPTPKAARPTPPPAPKGTGSGLLSSSDLFGGLSNSAPSERKGVNIELHIPLNPAGGNVINIAQEIVKKYGRDALNPRAAAHREQLFRIAMEQNKFADGSADDMSVDLLSDAEGDSNVEMGGMDDEKSNTGMEADKPTRKRRRKVEEYDKEDDFIDDTELAWQEQAAVAKDGFFIYAGPLIPEGEQPQIESAAPTRGRGRGGRGSRGGRTAGTGTTHASLAEKTRDSTTSSTRGSGRARAARGTGTTRKPRMTKADRERMEAEKSERERAGASSTMTAQAPPTHSMTSNLSAPQQQMQQTYMQATGSMA